MKSIWTGAISFGLIFIPVRLYNASEVQDLDFDLLRRSDHCRIRYARVCRETGDEVPNEEIVKGYQYKKGEYVILEEEDFKRANVQKRQTIDIISFVDASDIDEKFLEKPYYLEPTKEAKKAYVLLREALRQSGKVGVSRFIMRSRERIALIKAYEDVIVLNQMRYASEIRPAAELELPGELKLEDRELDMAVKLVNQLTQPWHPQDYRDTYVDELRKIIQDKVQGKQPTIEREEPIPVEVTDLFERLNQSLELAKSGGSDAFAPTHKETQPGD
jgi:DNA end-binding protein Ku